MQDTYNLVWKLCSVIKGIAKPNILSTYQTERRQVALDLIAADREISQYYSDSSNSKGTKNERFRALRERHNLFVIGVSVRYGESVLITKSKNTDEKCSIAQKHEMAT